ncbi:MAG: DoxX family protein [Bacteroidota bacterium]
MKNIIDLIGRVLLAFIFLYEAYDSTFFFKATKQKMLDYGLTWQPELLLYGAITLLTLGGLMVLSGYRSSFGAMLLLLYWIPVTFIVHDYWNLPMSCMIEYNCPEVPLQGELIYRRLQAILFMKNLAIIGGLLMIWVNGSGRLSIRRLFATTKVPGH